jgi:ribosome-associated protein
MNIKRLVKELTYKSSRSSGSGGQHVNKVETRMTLILDLYGSECLSSKEQQLIKEHSPRRISKAGLFQMHCDIKRNQLANKKELEARFVRLMKLIFKPVKKRIASKIPAQAKRKRLEKKKRISEKKQNRRLKPGPD